MTTAPPASPPPPTTPTGSHDDALDAFTNALRAVQRNRGAADSAEMLIYSFAYDLAMERANSAPASSDWDRAFRSQLRSILGDYGVEFRIPDTTMVTRAHRAHRLTTEFPDWIPAIQTATVQVAHATVMLQHTSGLRPDQFTEYGDAVLAFATKHTVARTKNYAQQLAAKLCAAEFALAHEQALRERRVRVQDADAGMSWLSVYLPSGLAHGIDHLLYEQARTLRDEHQADPASGDDRTIEQLKVDVFADTLLTATAQQILDEQSAAARVTGTISITVPVLALLRDPETLTSHDSQCDVALLDGTQPMSVAEARQWAGDAKVFERILTHPITGHVITADVREPTTSLRRYLRARDATCRFPGCRRPASGCDLDHTIPWTEGGPTTPDNLAHLCRAHHVQKHEHPWQVRNLGGGVLEWVTPRGITVTSEPVPTGPRFHPTGDPAPF